MNRRGEVVIQPKFTHCGDFHQGMAWATDESTIAFDQRKTKYGYINEQGTFAIEKQYVLAGDFSEDRALVAPDGDSIGYIDRTGQLVIQPKYNEAEDFNNGVALVG